MAITLLLHCKNLAETQEFYKSVLGFGLTETSEGFLTFEKFGGKVIFTPQNLWQSAAGCSATFYFTVPDVESYYTLVKDKVTVSWPLQNMSYGSREFGLTDCNGYYLAFQQQT